MTRAVQRRRTGLFAGLAIVLGALLWWLFLGSGPLAVNEPGADGVTVGDGQGLRGKKVLGREALALLADTGASISGRVLDPNGKPIAGALVCASSWSEELSSNQTRVPACTKADVAGHYRIEGLYRVRYMVRAGAPEHIPNHYDPPGDRDYVELRTTAEVTAIDITLEPGGVEIKGVVRDISGGEIEGAWVSQGGDWRWGGPGRGLGARTDPKGEFRLWVKAGEAGVSATAEGYAPGGDNGVAPGHYFEVLLTPESILVGKVVATATGNPVEGAKVHASGSWDNRWGGNTTFTDADGRFRIDRLQPGVYKPMAEVDGAFGMAASSVHLGLAQTSDDVLIEVHPAATVTGRVVLADAKDGGGACDRGYVGFEDKKEGLNRWGEIRANGEVEIKAVLPGSYEVNIDCDDAVAKEEYAKVEVGEEDVNGLQWEVNAGLAIRGTVVDAVGDAVADVSVMSTMDGGEPRGQRTRSHAETEDDGSFELTGLLPGAYKLEVWGDDEHVSPIEPTKVTLEGSDLEGVRIELEASGRITGRVEDELGEPIGSVEVRAMALERGWGENTRTADDGSFEMKAVRPGDYRVAATQGWRNQLRAPGQGDDDVHGELTVVRAGEIAEVTLVVERKDGAIRGQVIDEDAGPIADAFLAAERESESAAASNGRARQMVRWGWDRKPVLSDQDGRFEIGDLAPGKYTVHANRKGGGEGFVEHVEVGSDVTVQIEPTAKLAGVVKTSSGQPIERFTVTVREREKAIWRSDQCFRTNGKWSVDALPAGTYEVHAEAPQGTGEQKGIELGGTQARTDIVIELIGKGTIRGSLVDLHTGEPVPGRRVSAQAMGGGGGISFRDGDTGMHISDRQGQFEVEHVPAGKIRVVVTPQGFDFDDEYGFVWGAVAEAKAGEVTELPPIRMVKRRTKRQEKPGDLGFKTKEGEIGKEWHETPIEVAFIRPGGPAADTGLKIGDVITRVDGHDVGGENRYLFDGLVKVSVGTTVSISVKRGATVDIKAAKPVQ